MEDEPMLKYLRLNVELAMFAVILLAGCTGIGPGTVERDRFNYVNALSSSWKKQILLNLVKMRYVDAPIFLDVSSVISQYALEGTIDLGVSWNDPILGDSQMVGGSGKYTDRPTITYSPLTGDKFSRSLMTPIPISGFLLLIESGYPVDFLFRICVQTINGIDNRFAGKEMGKSADPRFRRLIEAMRRIQNSGGLGMRIKPLGDKKAIVIFFRSKIGDEMVKDINTVQQILGLNPDIKEIRVVHGAFAADDQEIAMLTRSMLQIMIDLASYIDVPAKDIEEGRVIPVPDKNASDMPPLIRIHSGASHPEDALVSIRYRDNWFWIDDRDFESKRMFSFLMMLFSLTETGEKSGAPIVTVPTN
ncbi:MAG: hypothetical protein LJE66_10210 [Desulfobacterales bacterium]|nr:hypothetical protein [Desulfobacterales bacterium]